LAEKANKASRLEQLIHSPGWKEFEAIVQDEYDTAMNDLLAKESAEARGACNVITRIMNSISADINFGNRARETYKKRYLNGNAE
jgi:hypothetical protein